MTLGTNNVPTTKLGDKGWRSNAEVKCKPTHPHRFPTNSRDDIMELKWKSVRKSRIVKY